MICRFHYVLHHGFHPFNDEFRFRLFPPIHCQPARVSPNLTQLLSAGPFAAGSFGENCSKRNISPGLFAAYSSSYTTCPILVGLLLGIVLCLNEDSFLDGTC